MGLDMFLKRINRNYFISLNGKFDSNDIYENSVEVGYWRKAVEIHRWFVDAVQGGKDNCEYYEVSKEKLETLLNLCKKAKASTKDVEYNERYLSNIEKTIKILEEVLAKTDFEQEVILYCSCW